MPGARVSQRGVALLGLAGGMFVVAGGLTATYYVVATRSEARAATVSSKTTEAQPKVASSTELPKQTVEVKTAGGTVKRDTTSTRPPPPPRPGCAWEDRCGPGRTRRR